MENTPDLPAYEDAARLLREAGVPTGAAEVHGIITGVLCAPQGARVAWQELVLGRETGRNRDPQTALSQLLVALHRSTHAHLSGLECDFAPLLPGDEHSLAEQIEGLSDWCRGYLLGLHAGGVPEGQALDGDAGEIIRDITRLSEAELDASLADEEEMRALVEIVEYLRVGVQLVFEELQPPASKH
ncbi:MAG: hypothetical protein A3E57_02470 [Candidatus Muproteobacteria bacterium RIFCSPHIGHO2_12_FULL_60_33]|uniref:YecA family protein n=1 Tax=Candidatus Muproteobacteria bacterium RIFCSPLOWO2_01_FULL_60_18 TaxID=1817768 RepID=A0A1F6U4Q2_9PROT|nr:MAG: hypothetical protein A3A87_06805 [Candidatus Muproteobacteria bacterium RIFCSPLOWO2_01_FULL_60_18]OGI54546.1 MAG: hypothetical protein A3E57_02470 [Candidatus Muproteobacteria bacterium RIFCSPHIGHO2_12_FULL_60_33]OGI55986.1 MAG: hypothetical protein A3D32_01225 [Candidatus Muproteobacteria bacterium RIFCSPHIGHO2_02_FULL_60_13]OGI59049.1 MAG: hypothetical protein A2809_00225 [Candidatus Muproteobacteria bacterium RIFCSPHIGHO2_01_FULL_61_200]